MTDAGFAIEESINVTIDMKAEQRKDKFLSRVKQWRLEDTRLSMEKISTLDYNEKLLWARFDEVILSDELLCLNDKDGHAKVIVPKQLRQELILKYHEGIGGGHLGFEKALIKIKKRFYWPRMKEDVKLACANCTRCGARKITTHALKRAMTPMAAGFQWERIAMDIVGPLPKTQRNNRYLFVVIDYYSRWPEAFTLENQDAH